MRQPISRGNYTDLLEAYKKGDIIGGDLMMVGEKEYMFRGMNKHGGPGMAHYAIMGMPSPIFGPTSPKEGNMITYIDPQILSWQKIGHRTPEEWKGMIEEVKRELAGQSNS